MFQAVAQLHRIKSKLVIALLEDDERMLDMKSSHMKLDRIVNI